MFKSHVNLFSYIIITIGSPGMRWLSFFIDVTLHNNNNNNNNNNNIG